MNLPMPDLRHPVRMTDDTGLFEHARGTVPRPAHGYCSDDAGRALAVTRRWEDPTADRLSEIYLAFLSHLHLGSGRFALRMGHDRWFIDRDISDDACGRAIFGLGVAAASTAPRHVTEGARELFSMTTSFRSRWSHVMAYAALGAAAALADDPDQPHAAELLRAAATMIQQATGHRHWPETRLRYANALLPECLLAAGAILNDTRFERTGLRLLEWLVAEETAPEGHFSFTPTHGWSIGEPRPAFDQQPIEAGAMADAAARAFTVTGQPGWADVTIRSAEWFIGRNDLGVAMFDDRTGGCFDGLQVDGPNVNQGAESTLAFLTALRRAHEVALPRAQACVA
jgi:hypothetical protein